MKRHDRRLLIDVIVPPPFSIGDEVMVWPNRADKFPAKVVSLNSNGTIEIKGTISGLSYLVRDYEITKHDEDETTQGIPELP